MERVNQNFNINYTKSVLALDLEKAVDTALHEEVVHKRIRVNVARKTFKMKKIP